MERVVQVMPQTFQDMMGKLHLLTVPACQSVGAPVQQNLQENTNEHTETPLPH